MSAIKIKRGLDLPISGALRSTNPVQAPGAEQVALLPPESIGIKAKLLVEVGDAVKIGSPLYFDKLKEQAPFTTPAAGKVVAIHRGHRRAVMAVVVQVEGAQEQVEFEALDPAKATRAELVEQLCRSGFWNCLRERPFDAIPAPDAAAQAIFITAADTQPLAPDPLLVLAGREDHFRAGLQALSRLTDGKTWLCTHGGDWSKLQVDGVSQQDFAGPHPAGNAGVHIHHLAQVGPKTKAWHIGYQDVADIGELLSSGRIPTERLVALVGPAVNEPKMLRCLRGASLANICKDAINCEQPRVISGSALSGLITQPGTDTGFLGRYANQITVLNDQPKQRFLDWVNPFAKQHTITNTILAKFAKREFDYDTDLNGGPRAIVPIGSYEEVMPMDILATQMFRALAGNDLETAEKLGVLELAEEDIALCEYVCPSKIELGALLRQMLTRIIKEG
jgi:Na+-transporting NADH:ubiquinone oxidoreductase subunit A